MSSDVPSGSLPNGQSSDQPAKERFESAIAGKMQDASGTPVERGLWEGGYSAKSMYGVWLLSAIVTIALLIAMGLYAKGENTPWMIAATCIVLWWCFVIGLYLYRRLSMHYELTTQRFIHQSGLLLRQTDRIEVIDIDDVSYTQGIVQRMLGVGTIRLTGSDRTHPELVIKGIDGVPKVASLIDDVRREERRRRSLHIEQI